METHITSPFTGRKILNLTGKKWNKLTAIKPVELPSHINRQKPNQFWLFECECGNTKVLDPNDVKRSKNPIQSCGCKKRKIIKRRKAKLFKDTSIDMISDNFMKWLKIQSESGTRLSRGITFNLSKQDIWNLWEKQQGKCAYTGIDLHIGFTTSRSGKEFTASLDRIDSTKPYTIDNLEWVHKKINIMKNKFSKQDFIEFCKLVTKNNNYES